MIIDKILVLNVRKSFVLVDDDNFYKHWKNLNLNRRN